jgi:hypothetical protein
MRIHINNILRRGRGGEGRGGGSHKMEIRKNRNQKRQKKFFYNFGNNLSF